MAVDNELILKQLREAFERSRTAVVAKSKPDSKDKEEDTAAREAAARVRALDEENEDKSSFRVLREKYAKWVYGYLIGYSLACFFLLLANGWHWWWFNLPPEVLSLLVGSTAVSAIGLVLAVTHGLFKR